MCNLWIWRAEQGIWKYVWILISMEVLEPMPCGYQGVTYQVWFKESQTIGYFITVEIFTCISSSCLNSLLYESELDQKKSAELCVEHLTSENSSSLILTSLIPNLGWTDLKGSDVSYIVSKVKPLPDSDWLWFLSFSFGLMHSVICSSRAALLLYNLIKCNIT